MILKVHHIFDEYVSISQKNRYLPYHFVPHVSISRKLNEQQTNQAFKILNHYFEPFHGKVIKIKSENLIKISKLIIKNAGRSSFKPNELQPLYEQISKGYETELSATDYKKIMGVMKEFVEFGGEVSFE